ncbi:addiction module protein [Rheinheimera sp.]|uniref:addiction module protein n=1 Tax=Rheinheimera sp. TaxID=1869214 RepID=UPI0035264291
MASRKSLNADERAKLAHELITSLDPQHGSDVGQQWQALPEQGVDEIEADYVAGLSWHDIKAKLSL